MNVFDTNPETIAALGLKVFGSLRASEEKHQSQVSQSSIQLRRAWNASYSLREDYFVSQAGSR
eukprot:m.950317 g.950317  ORF g.950317 m.950317 type:complete len:63 (+) comp329987_c0_seq1:259-447(+)